MITQELASKLDISSSNFTDIEFSDDSSRAIIIIPLMHVGANKKGLYWTAKMLREIAPMFRSVPYRYDLEGQEGSSHTLNKLSSPHFDVGWTYSSEDGAWYDDKTKTLWTKGEVTHPDVISKLQRVTSDGKREVNFASMGVIVEKAICSICGAEFGSTECENGHIRNEKYEGKTCYKVPTEISKALHVALTNDPADSEAEIKNVLFQELMSPEYNRAQSGEQMENTNLSNQIPTGLAPSAPISAQPGQIPSSENILRDLAERIRTIEEKVSLQAQSPEVVNESLMQEQPQELQTEMENGLISSGEQNKMDVKDAQANIKASPVQSEVQQAPMDPMQQIMQMLQQILSRLPGAEVQDMGKESMDLNKGQAKKAQDNIPMDHLEPGDSVGDSTDESNKKNKESMNKPEKTENADNSNNISIEIADLKEQFKVLKSKMEIQDNEVPEFGGRNNSASIDVADMGASKRREIFGEYGSWDACFNGASSASKFKRNY
ncbi:MAG: hypothetical protein PHP65_00615 [Bacilli bacterium]|nr:hypothetical protein [Bacilli bacterium]